MAANSGYKRESLHHLAVDESGYACRIRHQHCTVSVSCESYFVGSQTSKTMGDSPRGMHLRTGSASMIGAETSSAEDYLARFLTTKLSWKGKYERIFALTSTRFCTLDPKDFDLTNTWSYAAFVGLDLDPTDDQVFTIAFNGPKKEEQLKLRYKYRSYLVSEFLRLHAAFCTGSPVPGAAPAPAVASIACTKLTRHDTEINCVLDVAVDAILFKQPLASSSSSTNAMPVPLGRYAYTDLDHVTSLANSTTGFVLGYGGKDKIFFSSDRRVVLGLIEKAAGRVGVRLTSRGALTVESVKEHRRRFGDDGGELMGEFSVQKYSPRYEAPVRRILRVHTKVVLEIDGTDVVSRTPLKQLFGLVRTGASKSRFEVELVNGQRRMYASRDRDALLASLVDAYGVLAEANDVLSIAPTPSHSGLRLLPRFATEDPTETRTFFGDASIGSMFLKRLAAVGKYTAGTGHRAGVAAGRGLVSIACELNANVPLTGIQYYTKRSIIADALKPLSFQLRTVATCSPPAPKMAVALLQCFCRIATSYYGFLDMLGLPHFIENMVHFLQAEDALTVYWASLLLQRLSMHKGAGASAVGDDGMEPMARGSSADAEISNKRLIFADAKLLQSLLAPLQLRPNGQLASPLMHLGVLGTLEPALCSRRATTDPKDVQVLVTALVPFYDTLIRLLFRSYCAATVEACTLLVQTVLELCPIDVASSIKDAALREGLVLQHLYQAIFDAAFDQRVVSRYLISMWMSHHPPAKKLLSRLLPPGLVSCLEMRLLSQAESYQLDELEKASFEHHKVSFFNADLSPTQSASLASRPDDADDDEDSFVASMRRPNAASDHALFEEDVADTIVLPSSMTASTRSELFPTRSEGARSNVPDVALPRLVGKLHSEPRQSPNVYQDPAPRRAHRPTSGVGMHLSLLKRAFVTRRPSTVPSDAAVIKPPENFRILFHMLQQDHDTVDLLWTGTTRDELRAALVREIQVFRDHQAHEARAVWNYEEFRVTYHSLASALVVDGLHLRRLVAVQASDDDNDNDDDEEDTWQPPLHMEDMLLKQPKRFVSALYKRFLREYPYAEFRGQLVTTTTILHVLARVAWLYEGQYTLCADDVHHVVTLLTETRRKDILLAGLRALRAITKCPAHAAKLLSSESAIPWLVQLAQMAHVAQRIEHDDAHASWCVHLGDAPCTGPLTVAGLAAAIADIDVKACVFHVHDGTSDDCVGRCQPLDVIPQLRWELGLDATIATSAVAVAHDAIHIVCDLLHANPLLIGTTKVFPTPAAMRQTHEHLAKLVPLLAQYECPGLAEHVGHILVTLFDGQLPIDDVYLSGVFYLLFCYNGSAFADFGRFLQLAYAKQVRPDGTPRAILPELLPAAMLLHLERLSKHQVADLYCTNDIATPKVIWNSRMRATLRDACVAHVADFKRALTQQIASTYTYAPMAPVRYADLDDEVYVFGFYLDQFVRAIDSGDVVPLDDASAFLRQLTVAWRAEVDRPGASMTREEAADVLGLASPTADWSAIRAAYKIKATATCPEYALDDRGQFDDVQEAFEVLTAPRPSLLTPGYDAVRLRLILQTQVRLCRFYSTQLYTGSAFDLFGLLLAFLQEHCTSSARVPSLTTPREHDELVRLAAELLLESCVVLPAANGAALLAEAKRDVLEDVLTHCVDHLCVASSDVDASLYAEVASHVVQTMAMLVTTPAGRDWVLASDSLLRDLWRLLWLFQLRLDDSSAGYLYRSVRYALEAIMAMTESRPLQDKLVTSTGILWHLLQLLFAYDPSLDVSTSQIVVQNTILFDRHAPPSSIVEVVPEAKNVLSDLALGVLARLCGIFQDAPAHMAALELCSALLTPNGIAFLRRQKNRHAFFCMFHGDTTSPHLLWTSALRTELGAYLAPIVGDIESVPSRDDGVRFRFAALATHCVIANVYVGPLLDVLSSALETPSVDLVRSLALPEAFYIALFNFVESGKRDMPAYVGYGLDDAAILGYREVALRILGLLAPLTPALVEVGVLRSNSGLSTVMSFVLPPTHALFASSALDVGFAHVVVPVELFDRFRESTLRLLHVLGSSEAIGNALFQADLVVLLLHAILVEDDVSAEMLRVLWRLVTSAPSIARFVVESIWMYHLLLWLFPDASSVTDHDYGKVMQVPAAEVVTALASPNSVVSEEAMNVCIRFVPVTLVYEIMSAPANVERIVQGKYESPDLVWNDTMRAHLRRGLHRLALLVHQTKGGDVHDELLALDIDYAEVYSYPVVGDVYLLLYLENPIYPLRDPKFFLECLAEDYEKIVGHLLDAPSDAARSSFNPDLVMLRRQQAQVLPLLTSCIICVVRVFPVLIETLLSLKMHEKACGLFVSYQSHHKESRDDEILVCEQSLLRLFRVLFTSPKVVATLAYSPFNILSRLFAHVYLRRQGEYHAEAGFLLECVRRFVRNFPDNGDRNSDRNVVSIVCSFNLLESLLELIEHPMTLQRVLNPILTRATIVAILVDLENHKTQGTVAHGILKKSKKWDKIYRHEPTDAVWNQPEDKFLTGPAASADGMIRQYLAQKTPSVSTNTGPVPPAPSSGKRKLNVKGFFGH
ncbi:hypothetical protein SDRG_02574 [Saprolegnia diclina VS20]|uniref:DnaJ homologue subfamily C GRV2/DNAJC13 N-terminal domain-containing protein n=1 Tax=Saprolegnia diclina (strain VS20) TaxID=1156394 RepID=T0S468_SAPDV|nr:hypothetical protein SDRG_02574 [Saprolegnia diclina VS20]EQC39918.1 hypothetical protein SDRG_02574 [Saprolegnia diclina VS20]|eukprot:XP_008606392.1 hypothetical protein SDRG_02574 [Saprolegnia diclina VS20]